MVKLKSLKDFVSDVPSTNTAVLPEFPELIVHGPMMYGSVVVPDPLTTQLHAWKSESLVIAMGGCELPAASA